MKLGKKKLVAYLKKSHVFFFVELRRLTCQKQQPFFCIQQTFSLAEKRKKGEKLLTEQF